MNGWRFYQAEGETGGGEAAGFREGRRGEEAGVVDTRTAAGVVGEDAGAGAIEHAAEAHQEPTKNERPRLFFPPLPAKISPREMILTNSCGSPPDPNDLLIYKRRERGRHALK